MNPNLNVNGLPETCNSKFQRKQSNKPKNDDGLKVLILYDIGLLLDRVL